MQYYSLDVLCLFIAVIWLLKFLFKRYFVRTSSFVSNNKLKIQ